MFSSRQKLALHTIVGIVREFSNRMVAGGADPSLARDVTTALALSVSNNVHYLTTMSTWLSEGMISCFIQGNAIAMRWDYAEANPLVADYAGGLDFSFAKGAEAIEAVLALEGGSGTVLTGDASRNPLPDDSADVFFTDPPYYDVVPYSEGNTIASGISRLAGANRRAGTRAYRAADWVAAGAGDLAERHEDKIIPIEVFLMENPHALTMAGLALAHAARRVKVAWAGVRASAKAGEGISAWRRAKRVKDLRQAMANTRGVTLRLKYRPGWSEAQRAAARAKARALTFGDTVQWR